jgi:hypothetical protein
LFRTARTLAAGKGEGARVMNLRRIILRVLIVLVCWYAVVVWFWGFGAPSHVRWRAIQTNVHADAKRLEYKVLTHQQLSDALASLKLKWNLTEFKPQVFFENETNWFVRLEPEPATPFNMPAWWRVLLLDFSRARFKAVEFGSNKDAQRATPPYSDPAARPPQR